MKEKYFVIRTTKHGVEFKKYKCIDGYTKSKADCWKFSKQGAEAIAKRENERILRNHGSFIEAGIHYNVMLAN